MANPSDIVTDVQPSQAQGFSDPTLHLGWNEGSNVSPHKLSTRTFAEAPSEDPFTGLNLVQTHRVQPVIVGLCLSLILGTDVRQPQSLRNSWRMGNDLRIRAGGSHSSSWRHPMLDLTFRTRSGLATGLRRIWHLSSMMDFSYTRRWPGPRHARRHVLQR